MPLPCRGASRWSAVAAALARAAGLAAAAAAGATAARAEEREPRPVDGRRLILGRGVLGVRRECHVFAS